MDECVVHQCSKCVQQIRSCGTDVKFTLDGYTGKSQICYVGIKRLFKAQIQNKYEQFMVSNTTKKKPTRLDGAEWVTYAWGQIRADSITNTWPSIDVNLESQQYKYNCIK